MEDDDEFGDLYTDVLRPLISAAEPQRSFIQSPEPSVSRPVDPKLHGDDGENLYGAPNSIPCFKFSNSSQIQTLNLEPEEVLAGSSDCRQSVNSGNELENKVGGNGEDMANTWKNLASESAEPTDSRVADSGGDVKLQKFSFQDPNLVDESSIDIVVEERDDEDDLLVEKGHNLPIFDMDVEPSIPGLSITEVKDAANLETRDGGSGEADDWDSDSEDDLQIVLNDNHHGAVVMDRGGVAGTDDDGEDEDGDPLVIVADSIQNHQLLEEQDWGEDAAQGADGERKELGEATKVNGGLMVPLKIGYNNHGYHAFHSQFKYVRPGAAPMPGPAPAGPGGVASQVRPPNGMLPTVGRGRGDWRPAGTKGASPMQKGFHPGFGMPAWGSNPSGRAYGLEFTLPSHKTIFEVEVDSFEDKPWRLPGIDLSDFFNFGLNEESWKDYCKQLEQLRLEGTMQSKIRVYESGRTEQAYDPDLPPELAAAAGIHEASSENVNLVKTDAGQSDLAKVSARLRPPLPTGRAIQVECNFSERLPSIDTRPPRTRDSDAIIEIVLQDSADDDSSPGNDVAEQPELSEDIREGHEIEGIRAQNETGPLDGSEHGYNDRKREVVGLSAPFADTVHGNTSERDGTSRLPPEAPSQYHLDSRGQTPVYSSKNSGSPHEERRTNERTRDRSCNTTPDEGTQDNGYLDNQREESVESIGGKRSSLLSSPLSAGTTVEQGLEDGDGMHDELLLAEGSSEIEKDQMGLDKTSDSLKDDNSKHFAKKKKLSSRVEQRLLQEIDDGSDLKAARSNDNSKARSGSRDYQKVHDGVDEEVVQDGNSVRTRNVKYIKRPFVEEERNLQRKGRDERPETERLRMVAKGREDSYSRRDLDPISGHHLHVKTEGADRRKEREHSAGAWLWRDDNLHSMRSRGEDLRKRERVEDIGSRQRVKVRESERNDKDDHILVRKQLENGSWRGGHYDKDIGSRHRERDENLKSRYENIDETRSKRRKEEDHLRRDHAEREENLPNPREINTRRKRERDDVLDQRKRDDPARKRDDDHYSVRHKEENWLQRERVERLKEREEWHRPKQSHEEGLSKRERDEGRGGLRSGRVVEDQPRVNHARIKGEYKASDRDYQSNEGGRQGEQLKRKDRIEDGSLSHPRGHVDVHGRGNQLNNDERISRQERASSRTDHAAHTSDNYRVAEKKHKENTRKSKEFEGGDNNSSVPSKKSQEDLSRQRNETVFTKGVIEQKQHGEHVSSSSRKHKEDAAASSDDEQQDSRRGRSKMERWTSHKERDFSIIGNKASSKVKEMDKYNNTNGGGSSFPIKKFPDESSKPPMADLVDNQQMILIDEKNVASNLEEEEDKNLEEEKHLDTVAKLKKRSERFKLPMPGEKETAISMTVKKVESEPLLPSSAQAETSSYAADSEIKQERPTRKRRWISS